ncbi:hypothetical protein ACFU8W_52335 [Streptomyces sp. NPDC057565]|uniref:hypothetical protein n=1 Tax=Streptomyces sp. NPDC057565 TaxID=3346169 RepID=UPI00369CC2B0
MGTSSPWSSVLSGRNQAVGVLGVVLHVAVWPAACRSHLGDTRFRSSIAAVGDLGNLKVSEGAEDFDGQPGPRPTAAVDVSK